MTNAGIKYGVDGKAHLVVQHDDYFTIQPLENQFVLYTRKEGNNTRQYQGLIVSADRNLITIKLKHISPKSDEIVYTTIDGPWILISGIPLTRIIDAVLGAVPIINPEIRCNHTKKSVHAKTASQIILQCVKESGHNGACHYENPFNEKQGK